MSDVDLLRRAAKTLRDHVMSLPEPWASRPWRTVQTDTYNNDGIAACTNKHADDPSGAFDCCWSSEPIGHETVASLAVLMHPPVALALAAWLEFAAGIAPSSPSGYVGPDYAGDVARAVLREEES